MATVVFGEFEWDDNKAATNLIKHGVTFEEATTVFLDLNYLLRRDKDRSERFLALGISQRARLLLIVHIEAAERIRIISARKATGRERRTYEQRQ